METERNMLAEICRAFDDGEDRLHGPRLGGGGDMLSTFLHLSGAHTRHRKQPQHGENTQVM